MHRYRFAYALLGSKLYVYSGFALFDCGSDKCPAPERLASTVVYDTVANT